MYRSHIQDFFSYVSTNGLFRCVFATDQIPDSDTGDALFIVNTEPSFSTERGHWIVMGEVYGYKIFFDSFGRPPEAFNSYISCFASKYHYEYNPFSFQCFFTLVCGYYCIFLIVRVAEGRLPFEIKNELMASGNSDKYVVEQVTEIFYRAVENSISNELMACGNSDKCVVEQVAEKHQKAVERWNSITNELMACVNTNKDVVEQGIGKYQRAVERRKIFTIFLLLIYYVVFIFIQMRKGWKFYLHTYSNLNYGMYEDEMMEVD